jgi:syntaxin-binding protein 1
MDAAQFPFTRQSDAEMQEDISKPGANVPASGVSLRSTKPTWSNKKNSVGVSEEVLY